MTPHPRTNPEGHSYGEENGGGEGVHPLTVDGWAANETYLFGVDLYNYAYWWEAHEQWELLWRMECRGSEIALFLRGLIQASASVLKLHQGNRRGSGQLFRRCQGNLLDGAGGRERHLGIAVRSFIEHLARNREIQGNPSTGAAPAPPLIELRPSPGARL